MMRGSYDMEYFANILDKYSLEIADSIDTNSINLGLKDSKVLIQLKNNVKKHLELKYKTNISDNLALFYASFSTMRAQEEEILLTSGNPKKLQKELFDFYQQTAEKELDSMMKHNELDSMMKHNDRIAQALDKIGISYPDNQTNTTEKTLLNTTFVLQEIDEQLTHVDAYDEVDIRFVDTINDHFPFIKSRVMKNMLSKLLCEINLGDSQALEVGVIEIKNALSTFMREWQEMYEAKVDIDFDDHLEQPHAIGQLLDNINNIDDLRRYNNFVIADKLHSYYQNLRSMPRDKLQQLKKPNDIYKLADHVHKIAKQEIDNELNSLTKHQKTQIIMRANEEREGILGNKSPAFNYTNIKDTPLYKRMIDNRVKQKTDKLYKIKEQNRIKWQEMDWDETISTSLKLTQNYLTSLNWKMIFFTTAQLTQNYFERNKPINFNKSTTKSLQIANMDQEIVGDLFEAAKHKVMLRRYLDSLGETGEMPPEYDYYNLIQEGPERYYVVENGKKVEKYRIPEHYNLENDIRQEMHNLAHDKFGVWQDRIGSNTAGHTRGHLDIDSRAGSEQENVFGGAVKYFTESEKLFQIRRGVDHLIDDFKIPSFHAAEYFESVPEVPTPKIYSQFDHYSAKLKRDRINNNIPGGGTSHHNNKRLESEQQNLEKPTPQKHNTLNTEQLKPSQQKKATQDKEDEETVSKFNLGTTTLLREQNIHSVSTVVVPSKQLPIPSGSVIDEPTSTRREPFALPASNIIDHEANRPTTIKFSESKNYDYYPMNYGGAVHIEYHDDGDITSWILTTIGERIDINEEDKYEIANHIKKLRELEKLDNNKRQTTSDPLVFPTAYAMSIDYEKTKTSLNKILENYLSEKSINKDYSHDIGKRSTLDEQSQEIKDGIDAAKSVVEKAGASIKDDGSIGGNGIKRDINSKKITSIGYDEIEKIIKAFFSSSDKNKEGTEKVKNTLLMYARYMFETKNALLIQQFNDWVIDFSIIAVKTNGKVKFSFKEDDSKVENSYDVTTQYVEISRDDPIMNYRLESNPSNFMGDNNYITYTDMKTVAHYVPHFNITIKMPLGSSDNLIPDIGKKMRVLSTARFLNTDSEDRKVGVTKTFTSTKSYPGTIREYIIDGYRSHNAPRIGFIKASYGNKIIYIPENYVYRTEQEFLSASRKQFITETDYSSQLKPIDFIVSQKSADSFLNMFNAIAGSLGSLKGIPNFLSDSDMKKYYLARLVYGNENFQFLLRLACRLDSAKVQKSWLRKTFPESDLSKYEKQDLDTLYNIIHNKESRESMKKFINSFSGGEPIWEDLEKWIDEQKNPNRDYDVTNKLQITAEDIKLSVGKTMKNIGSENLETLTKDKLRALTTAKHVTNAGISILFAWFTGRWQGVAINAAMLAESHTTGIIPSAIEQCVELLGIKQGDSGFSPQEFLNAMKTQTKVLKDQFAAKDSRLAAAWDAFASEVISSMEQRQCTMDMDGIGVVEDFLHALAEAGFNVAENNIMQGAEKKTEKHLLDMLPALIEGHINAIQTSDMEYLAPFIDIINGKSIKVKEEKSPKELALTSAINDKVGADMLGLSPSYMGQNNSTSTRIKRTLEKEINDKPIDLLELEKNKHLETLKKNLPNNIIIESIDEVIVGSDEYQKLQKQEHLMDDPRRNYRVFTMPSTYSVDGSEPTRTKVQTIYNTAEDKPELSRPFIPSKVVEHINNNNDLLWNYHTLDSTIVGLKAGIQRQEKVRHPDGREFYIICDTKENSKTNFPESEVYTVDTTKPDNHDLAEEYCKLRNNAIIPEKRAYYPVIPKPKLVYSAKIKINHDGNDKDLILYHTKDGIVIACSDDKGDFNFPNNQKIKEHINNFQTLKLGGLLTGSGQYGQLNMASREMSTFRSPAKITVMESVESNLDAKKYLPKIDAMVRQIISETGYMPNGENTIEYLYDSTSNNKLMEASFTAFNTLGDAAKNQHLSKMGAFAGGTLSINFGAPVAFLKKADEIKSKIDLLKKNIQSGSLTNAAIKGIVMNILTDLSKPIYGKTSEFTFRQEAMNDHFIRELQDLKTPTERLNFLDLLHTYLEKVTELKLHQNIKHEIGHIGSKVGEDFPYGFNLEPKMFGSAWNAMERMKAAATFMVAMSDSITDTNSRTGSEFSQIDTHEYLGYFNTLAGYTFPDMHANYPGTTYIEEFFTRPIELSFLYSRMSPNDKVIFIKNTIKSHYKQNNIEDLTQLLKAMAMSIGHKHNFANGDVARAEGSQDINLNNVRDFFSAFVPAIETFLLQEPNLNMPKASQLRDSLSEIKKTALNPDLQLAYRSSTPVTTHYPVNSEDQFDNVLEKNPQFGNIDFKDTDGMPITAFRIDDLRDPITGKLIYSELSVVYGSGRTSHGKHVSFLNTQERNRIADKTEKAFYKNIKSDNNSPRQLLPIVISIGTLAPVISKGLLSDGFNLAEIINIQSSAVIRKTKLLQYLSVAATEDLMSSARNGLNAWKKIRKIANKKDTLRKPRDVESGEMYFTMLAKNINGEEVRLVMPFIYTENNPDLAYAGYVQTAIEHTANIEPKIDFGTIIFSIIDSNSIGYADHISKLEKADQEEIDKLSKLEYQDLTQIYLPVLVNFLNEIYPLPNSLSSWQDEIMKYGYTTINKKHTMMILLDLMYSKGILSRPDNKPYTRKTPNFNLSLMASNEIDPRLIERQAESSIDNLRENGIDLTDFTSKPNKLQIAKYVSLACKYSLCNSVDKIPNKQDIMASTFAQLLAIFNNNGFNSQMHQIIDNYHKEEILAEANKYPIIFLNLKESYAFNIVKATLAKITDNKIKDDIYKSAIKLFASQYSVGSLTEVLKLQYPHIISIDYMPSNDPNSIILRFSDSSVVVNIELMKFSDSDQDEIIQKLKLAAKIIVQDEFKKNPDKNKYTTEINLFKAISDKLDVNYNENSSGLFIWKPNYNPSDYELSIYKKLVSSAKNDTILAEKMLSELKITDHRTIKSNYYIDNNYIQNIVIPKLFTEHNLRINEHNEIVFDNPRSNDKKFYEGVKLFNLQLKNKEFNMSIRDAIRSQKQMLDDLIKNDNILLDDKEDKIYILPQDPDQKYSLAQTIFLFKVNNNRQFYNFVQNKLNKENKKLPEKRNILYQALKEKGYRDFAQIKDVVKKDFLLYFMSLDTDFSSDIQKVELLMADKTNKTMEKFIEDYGFYEVDYGGQIGFISNLWAGNPLPAYYLSDIIQSGNSNFKSYLEKFNASVNNMKKKLSFSTLIEKYNLRIEDNQVVCDKSEAKSDEDREKIRIFEEAITKYPNLKRVISDKIKKRTSSQDIIPFLMDKANLHYDHDKRNIVFHTIPETDVSAAAYKRIDEFRRKSQTVELGGIIKTLKENGRTFNLNEAILLVTTKGNISSIQDDLINYNKDNLIDPKDQWKIKALRHKVSKNSPDNAYHDFRSKVNAIQNMERILPNLSLDNNGNIISHNRYDTIQYQSQIAIINQNNAFKEYFKNKILILRSNNERYI